MNCHACENNRMNHHFECLGMPAPKPKNEVHNSQVTVFASWIEPIPTEAENQSLETAGQIRERNDISPQGIIAHQRRTIDSQERTIVRLSYIISRLEKKVGPVTP